MTIKCSCNGFFFVDLSLSFVCSLGSSCARNVLVKLCYAEFAYHRIGSQVMNRAEVHLLKNLIIGHKYKKYIDTHNEWNFLSFTSNFSPVPRWFNSFVYHIFCEHSCCKRFRTQESPSNAINMLKVTTKWSYNEKMD